MSTLEEIFLVITVGGVAISTASLIPRIGPGRAVWIALRSRFAFKPVPESLRLAEINLLKRRITDKDFGQGYLVVTGEKGVGKTCLLDTVTSKTPGVIKMEAQPGQNQDTVIKNALLQLTNPPFRFMDPFKSAPKVLFWYRFFTLGRSPIIVINATERKVGEEYASLTGAVRTLVDRYKLRVVVDGSPNSLDESLLRTTRQRVIDIKPMTREMIWQIEELEDLFKFVKEAELESTLFAVLGGIPSRYLELWDNAKIDLQGGNNPRQVIGAHLCAEIYASIQVIEDSKSKSNHMEAIIKLFDKDMKWIPRKSLTVRRLQQPTPDKVFRRTKRNGISILIPTSDAICIVLQHSLEKEPSLSELEELLKNKVLNVIERSSS